MSPIHTGSMPKFYRMPFTRVEIAVMSLIDGRLHVLLARREKEPHAGKWALPGGVLRIDLDRSLDAAAQRVMQERLGAAMPFLRQLTTVGGPARDPRAPWTLSVVYRALVPTGAFAPEAGKRVEALDWRAIENAATDKSLAFDHAALVADAARITRSEIESLQLPFGFLPEHFTLSELQETCGQLLGRPLDKSSFRRRLAERHLLEPVEGAMKTGAFRPAQLYRQKRS